MQKYEFMCDGQLEIIIVAKHRIVSKSLDSPPIYSAPYPAGHRNGELERVEVA